MERCACKEEALEFSCAGSTINFHCTTPPVRPRAMEAERLMVPRTVGLYRVRGRLPKVVQASPCGKGQNFDC